ncbi:MAG: dihydropteroate synthase [Candidatus Omnitrophica bacterium]|nr:dihydropteroate synthase [Candidatus Omnitrophota bacterium]MCM8793884.1 dihydropteroate synthase [Candidatus Omnitrophota bacterium]
MFIIGERINGMFKDVSRAIKEKNKRFIQELALKQIEKGANALDVNIGTAVEDPVSAMEWLVKTITEVTEITLSIDTTKLVVMEAGLRYCKSKPIINSTSADDEKLNNLIALAKKYNAGLIGLTMSNRGIPSDANSRLELAMHILTRWQGEGLLIDDLYIDGVILPVNVAQAQCPEVLETIRQVKLLSQPPPKTVLGLSNVSQGTKYRSLINRTYLVMALASGLDAAILDPLDEELIKAIRTAEILLNKTIYCDYYLKGRK